jgi:glycosyltransferase involved in cell wall biosynthesis
MTAKISMIRNGVDLTAFDNTTGSLKAELGWNELLLVGFVGRLSMEKGADIFLHMIARVFEKLPNVRFVLAGDGPDRAHLEALIDSLGIRRSVRVLGRREDIPNVLASLDVLVSSSRQEGLPISILEGMASRLAIIATAVGEVPILIQNERTGLLVPSADANLLAEAIIELSQNPAKRRELGLAARQLVEEEYSATRMANDYLRIYEEAVAVSTRGRANE